MSTTPITVIEGEAPRIVSVPTGLLHAARSLWDSNATLAQATAENPEYLRGQIETIMQAADWNGAVMDSDEVREAIEAAIWKAAQ